jgi:hypothetical protein
VDLGVVGLAIHVLEQEPHACLASVVRCALQAVEGGLLAPLVVAREVIPGVNHDPAGRQAMRQIHVGAEIFIDGVAQIRRSLGDIDRGQDVQTEADPVPVPRRAHFFDASSVERLERIRRIVDADGGIKHLVRRGPGERVLEPHLAAEVDPDPLTQPHREASRLSFRP